MHTHYREPGGEDAVVDREAALLRDAGHEVLSYRARNPAGAVPAGAVLSAAAWNSRASARVSRLVRRQQPDVVHVHNTWFALSPAVFAAVRSEGVPVVTTLHNYRATCSAATLYRDGQPCELCVGSHPLHGVWHRCYRDSVVASAAAATTIGVQRRRGTWHRDVDRFVAVSEAVRARLVAAGLPPARLVVKPNSTADPGKRTRPPSASEEVLYVGRLAAEKGIGELVRAWSDRDRHPMRLLIVGDGPQRAALARSTGTTVELLGHVSSSRVRELMLDARALVFPSRWHEPFGLVAAEALAAGLPVIASDMGGIGDVVGRDEGAGWLVDDRVGGWSRALRVLDDPAALDRAGRRARRRWERRFSPQVDLQATVEIYRSTVGERERSDVPGEEA